MTTPDRRQTLPALQPRQFVHTDQAGRLPSAWEKDPLAQARSNHDDSTAALDMFERCLSSNEGPADVDRENAVEIRKCRLFD